MPRGLITEFHDFFGVTVMAEVNRLWDALQEDLDECQAKKRAESERRRQQQRSDGERPWIAFVGGRMFNEFETWDDNNFGSGDDTSNDPGAGGVLQPGDPGYGGGG